MSDKRAANLAILVAALGYFVDIYDLILFSVVRVRSLVAIGVPEDQLLDAGVRLLNLQMFGMLVGGILWGVLGDRRGRLSVLFGSILLYSLANLANAMVTSVEMYGALRFIAGIGLAGELGAGITLVAELMHRQSRGYGTTLVASVGILGAIAAELVAESFDWRVAYVVGGVLGLALLVLRVSVRESHLFQQVKTTGVARGDFLALITDRGRLVRYLAVIMVAVPIWYVIGILVTFAPEFAKAMSLPYAPSAGRSILWLYAGLVVGDLASGLLSQWIRSRRKAIALFLALTVVGCAAYFLRLAPTLAGFYALCVGMGFTIGYWAVFITMAAEQFGTNLRATATTTAPNFVRGAVVPMTWAFQTFRDGAGLGVVGGGVAVGVIVLGLAVFALVGLDETFGRDLDYVE
ncbi:MAG: MFS transporter [Gemmatimonadetes bacterium]|nr:MFS transporter [Gemmatimonadota bacterium]